MAESVSRRQKRDNTGVNDRISDLPDSLLCHILSFLPTKQAIATSILSKRWKPLWLYIPSFDFNDSDLHASNEIQYSRFVQLVYTFLVSRNVQPIKRFRLKCVSCFTSNHNIIVWVNAAILGQVEHLVMEWLPTNIYLPSTIFTCKTLVVLKLNYVDLDAISSVSLPSLKILHLRAVRFSKISCVPKLLSGCTLLENLVISKIVSSHYELALPHVFTIDLPKLISADVRSCCIWVFLTAFSKAKFLHYDIPDLYFLRKCHIPMPVFHNLVHMELNFFGHYNWNFLAKILRNSPNLQILVLMKEFDYEAYTNDHFVAGEMLLPPLLKKCYVGGFEGNESEMQFARCIMEKSTLLNTITISTSTSSNLDEKFQMRKKISSFSKLSTTCQLYFE